MKALRYVFILLFFTSCSYNLVAQQIPGSQYYYLGNGISFFPLGASGVPFFMTMDSNLYNPAAYADTRRVTTDLSVGGFAGDNFLLNARGSFPTNFGVITGNVLVLTSPGGITAGDIVGFKGTFSKFISEEWLFGTALNVGLADGPETEYYTSMDIGTIYRKARDGTGIGLFDYSIGGAFKNVGKNISYSGFDNFPPLGIDLGARFEVVRKGFYKSRVGGHVMVPFNPFDVFFGVGLENIFADMINIKLGLNFGIEDIDPYSLGLDFNFNIEDTDIQLSYSFLPTEFNGEQQYTHNAGVSVAFGTYDKKPPVASVQTEKNFFSPNHDGVNDRAKFDMSIKDNTMVFGWRFDVTDEAGNPVKSFEAQDVRKIRHMTLGKYLKRIFAKKQEVEIPEYIEWDGEDAQGSVVEDGNYSYTLVVWDENNNETVTDKATILVDTTVPLVEANVGMFLFSPNGDGIKDTLPLTISSANIEDDDRVHLMIADKNKNVVFEKEFRGFVPESYTWDGRNTGGALVPEGTYSFSVTAWDRAENKSTSSVEGIIVKTEYEKVSAAPSLKKFSPNNDGYYDINDIRLFSSSKEGLSNWDLDVLNLNDEIERNYSGERDFPEVIHYDGKDMKGNMLPDGKYTLRFRLVFDSGNHPESFFKFMEIDTTTPLIKVTSNVQAFSPNRDGIKDTLSLIHEVESGEGDRFTATLTNAAGAVFKTFNYGATPPGAVVWDGTGDNNTEPVEGTYTYCITGVDDVANEVEQCFGPIKLVTGFEQVSVAPSDYVFSPNADGTKDTVTFMLSTDSRAGIVEWKLDIRDFSGNVVKSFNDKTMAPELPEEILWDGSTDIGSTTDDGAYSTNFSILYDTGNNPIAKPKDLLVDTQSPEIEIYVDDLHISPNNDGAKETLTIYQRVRAEASDRFIAYIADVDGDTVKEFSWTGIPPSEIIWDGRDESGDPLPEGLYSYSIQGRDSAGNTSDKKISKIKLTTTYEGVSLVANQTGISPNDDGVVDVLELVPSISSEIDLRDWYLDIYNWEGKLVRSLEGPGKPPSLVIWDGKDDAGDSVPDGNYFYILGLLYNSGNHPAGETMRVVVDTTPPVYNFVVSPQLFSPDGDGEADTMYINLELGDRNEVSDWEINIFRKWEEKIERTAPFKRYSGKGEYRGTIRWDGFSDPVPKPANFIPPDDYSYTEVNGKWEVLVDSASSYVVELTASDIYSNKVYVKREFDTDILVIKTPYGLKIMINSIQFEFDKADLMPQSYTILNRLIQILEKFPNYRVNIVGHTDSTGTEEYNQKLSEKRAYSVYKYLFGHDVEKERLTAEGRGETQSIDDNATESGRARNRRVEFYLTKKPL
jgi:outer membrane protein OmpA-like peptidoglycan-associated protein/flagellar hook assembly protein FlgD